jgi:hypothetical protein
MTPSLTIVEGRDAFVERDCDVERDLHDPAFVGVELVVGDCLPATCNATKEI